MKLVIDTLFPIEVAAILSKHELASAKQMTLSTWTVEIAYPDDALSQAMGYWLCMATGCGLVNGHREER